MSRAGLMDGWPQVITWLNKEMNEAQLGRGAYAATPTPAFTPVSLTSCRGLRLCLGVRASHSVLVCGAGRPTTPRLR